MNTTDTSDIETFAPDHLYAQVAGDLAGLIENGTFRAGERVPSVRELSKQRQVSITTVLQAYRLLEDRGLIEVRPQSGYFVRSRLETGLPEPDQESDRCVPSEVSVEQLVKMVMHDSSRPELVQFGAAVPDPALLPSRKLNLLLATIARLGHPQEFNCGRPEGSEELRVQVAQRAFNAGCHLAPDDILITNGCLEAVSLALRAVCKPGDTVAVESPTYFGMLQVIETQGLRALEIPTHPRTGISLDALRFAIEHQPVHACLISSNFNNPLGSSIPEDHKKELVELLAAHEIPLVEDDLNGDLYFGDQRPRVAKAYDRKGLVLLCSSFSKDLSPSYRIGWIAPGRFKAAFERNKMATNVSTALLPQLAIAQFLSSGGYDHHLRRIRQAYIQKVRGMAQDILHWFPAGCRVSSPAGGFVLWVQLPEQVDSLALYRSALSAGITLAPGYIFSATSRYRNFIRLNAGHYSPENAWAVRKLGELAGERAAPGNR